MPDANVIAATQPIEDEEDAPAGGLKAKWAILRDRVFARLWNEDTDQPTLRKLRARVVARAWGNRSPKAASPLPTKDRIAARLLLSMIDWRLTGTLEVPFRSIMEAKMQYWDIEWSCPLTDYQTAFLRAANEKFPDVPVFGIFLKIFETLDNKGPRMLESRRADFQVVLTPGAKVTVVGFSGIRHSCLGIGWPTFYRATAEQAKANLVVLKDHDYQLFLGGIRTIGDKQKTAARLRELMAEPQFAGTEFVFLGASGGTFGALVYAGLLGVKRVIGLSGPVSIEIGLGNEDKHVYKRLESMIAAGELEHEDPTKRVREGGVERIDYFVAGHHEFDQLQCRHLLENTDCAVQHVYPTSSHMITDFCIADGRLVAAIRGDKLEPLLL